MMVLLFCDTDAEGNITSSLHGRNVIPTRQYEHFFYLNEEIDVSEYLVINGELIRKEA